MKADGAFYIDTGLDPIRVAGPICWAGSPNNLQPILKGRPGEDVPVGSPMPKSVSFLRKGKKSTVDGDMIVYLSLVGLLGIYSG